MYTKKTKQGFDITTFGLYKEPDGAFTYFAIFHRKKLNDYNIAIRYNFYEGTWAQGIYDFKTEADAIAYIAKRKHEIKLY